MNTNKFSKVAMFFLLMLLALTPFTSAQAYVVVTGGGPAAVWVPGHWQGPYWIDGHYVRTAYYYYPNQYYYNPHHYWHRTGYYYRGYHHGGWHRGW